LIRKSILHFLIACFDLAKTIAGKVIDWINPSGCYVVDGLSLVHVIIG
jgi:hypothetical protein